MPNRQYKIRLFNEEENRYRYPDGTGRFYVHHVDQMIVWDNIKDWGEPHLFSFAPATIQYFFGKYDKFGQEIYVGKLKIMEVSSFLFQHDIWVAACNIAEVHIPLEWENEVRHYRAS